MRSSWIKWVALNPMTSVLTRERKRRWCEDRGRDWSDAATGPGMSGATRSCERQRVLPGTLKRAWLYHILFIRRESFGAAHTLERIMQGLNAGGAGSLGPSRRQPPTKGSSPTFPFSGSGLCIDYVCGLLS